jgi:hypothetical protein
MFQDIPSFTYLMTAFVFCSWNQSVQIQTDYGFFPPSLLVVLVLWIATRCFAGCEQAAAVAYTSFILAYYRQCDLVSKEGDAVPDWWFVVLAIVQLSGLMLGHELLHKPKTSRFWACLVLSQNGYLVYIWEHIFHHRHAGTSLDLASTKRHTSVYEQLLFKYPTHIRSAFRHYPKALLMTSLVFLAYVATIAFCLSQEIAMLFVKMTLFHWLLIDIGTYTSHYGVVGLQSRDIAWDSRMWPFLSPFFYGIEHHPEHHYRISSPARSLKDRGNLKYPITLELVLLVALVPPFWFRMTDPILDAAELRKQIVH